MPVAVNPRELPGSDRRRGAGVPSTPPTSIDGILAFASTSPDPIGLAQLQLARSFPEILVQVDRRRALQLLERELRSELDRLAPVTAKRNRRALWRVFRDALRELETDAAAAEVCSNPHSRTSRS